MTDPSGDVSLLISDPRVLGAILASLAVFTPGKIYDIWATAKVKRDGKLRLINAIYTEIGHNKEELIKAVEKSPSTAALMRALEEDDQRTVHMVYARRCGFRGSISGDTTLSFRNRERIRCYARQTSKFNGAVSV